jgi:uncharacterized protein (TIGR02594 family)
MPHPFQPAWLDHAWAELGVLENTGTASNPRVVAYYRDAGHAHIRSDAVAWCAAFLGACLKRANITPTGSLLARSYLAWGDEIDEPRFGAIAVLTRGDDPGQGHVGFLVGATSTHLFLLGGNQSDAVRVDAFDRSRLLSLRWPSDRAPANAPQPASSFFDIALAHVLEMEGGWTEDPYDPGGPTNLGITLATYAAWKRIPLTADNFDELRAELRTLDPATARTIYQARYWTPSSAAELPPALALMHFDASVNHGVGGGAHMLQQALGVAVDGEIGPETLAAAHSRPLPATLDTYAALRLARYQALSTYWRFGRGWTNRVNATRKAADALLSHTLSTKEPTMPDASTAPVTTTPTVSPPKWWGESLTIWGVIVTTLSTVLPAVGPLIGIDITAEMVRDLGQHLTQLIQALGGVIGVVMTILGRLRAVQPLIRRDVTLKL